MAYASVFKYNKAHDEKGRFATTDSSGVSSDPKLVAQSVAGIAAVEKLLPQALQSLEYAPQSWEDVDPTTKAAMFAEWHSRVPTMSRADADAVFDKLPNYHKLAQLHEAIHDKLIPQPPAEPPKQWRTGLEITDDQSVASIKVEYDRTRELANHLVTLRTAQVMEERGLLKPPVYTIHGDFGVYNAKGELLHQAVSQTEAEEVAHTWQEDQLKLLKQGAVSLPRDVWTSWKNSSSSGLALSLQLATAQEFGGHHRLTDQEVADAEERAESYGGMDTFRAYVRAQWEVTQTVLDKAGQSEVSTYRALMLRRKDVDATTTEFRTPFGKVLKPTNITHSDETPSGAEVSFTFDGRSYTSVKRQMNNGEFEDDTPAINRRLEREFEGLHRFNIQLPDIELKRAGLQSTTSLASVANTWDGAGHMPADPVRVVLRLATPRTSVLSIPVFGQNVSSEQEAVVMGSTDHWLWDAWRGEAPLFSTLSLEAPAKKRETTTLLLDLQALDRGQPHWLSGVRKYDESQPRGAKGTPTGGRWVKEGGKEYLIAAGQHTDAPDAPLVGRRFTSDEGYAFHETGPVVDWATSLPYKDSQVFNDYAGFGYHEVNDLLRGKPPTREKRVRGLTAEEIAAVSRARQATNVDIPDPIPPEGPAFRYSYSWENRPEREPLTSENSWALIGPVVDPERLALATEKAQHLDQVIAQHGYVLPEDIQVERGAYLPGVSFEDLQRLVDEGQVLTEKGFTSTMVGDAGGRAKSYPVSGKFESIYHRDPSPGSLTRLQDEVGSAIRFHIVLPAGTKVAPIETLRRLEYEFPRIPDPAPRPPDIGPEYWTMRDYSAAPTISTKRLEDTSSRSESEVLLGSGARFKVVKVTHGEKVSSGDPTLKPVQIEEVWLEYIGGGSSDGHGSH